LVEAQQARARPTTSTATGLPAVQRVFFGSRGDLDVATTAAAHHRLKRPYRDAIGAGDWDTVAELFSQPPATSTSVMAHWQMTVLQSLTSDQLRYLDDAARRSGRENTSLRSAIEDSLMALGVSESEAEPGTGYGRVTVTPPEIENGSARFDRDTFKWILENPYSYTFELEFTPGPGAGADEIGFIQTARVVDVYNGGHMGVNGADRRTADNTRIDQVDDRAQGWYGMLDEQGTKFSFSRPCVRGGEWDSAVMRDDPTGHHPDVEYSFETSVTCRKGADAGKVYAVVTWGFKVDHALKVTDKGFTIFNKPSRRFGAAIDAWNAQASGPMQRRNTPNQQLLPTLR
jgi:hypothetical protein